MTDTEIDLSNKTPDYLSELAEKLRLAHCSRRNDRTHACLGVCRIDRSGVLLDCQLCGADNQYRDEKPEASARRAAKAIVEAAGMKWKSLSVDSRREATEQAAMPWSARNK